MEDLHDDGLAELALPEPQGDPAPVDLPEPGEPTDNTPDPRARLGLRPVNQHPAQEDHAAEDDS